MIAPMKVVLLALAATCSSAAKLPSYITPCSRNPATLNDCATKEAIKAVPHILNGDKSLKIPNLKPLKLPEVKIDVAGNLNIKLTDITIDGFEDHTIKNVDINLDKQHITMQFLFPRLNLISQYTINGRILVLPIRGSGPANITFVGGEYTFNTDFEVEKRAGTEYLKLVNPKLDFITKRSYYRLDNLFDGDKALGEQMNTFLNENWQDVSKDLGPAIGDIISSIATSIINSIFQRIPYPELFQE